MAVLCEAISVIIRADALTRAYDNFEAFKEDLPNRTLAADGELVRVDFMSPDDVRAFIAMLERRGLRYVVEGKPQDVAVVDQLRGPTMPSDWLEFGHVGLDGNKVAVARLAGSSLHQVLTPDGWAFEGSLSHTFGFVPEAAKDKALQFLRSESGLDVYLNRLTGQEVYVGRTSGS